MYISSYTAVTLIKGVILINKTFFLNGKAFFPSSNSVPVTFSECRKKA